MARITLIGIGEAGLALAGGLGAVVGYDRKLENEGERASLQALAHAAGIEPRASNADAVVDAGLILSLVTADQALVAAHDVARSIMPGALYYDMNSVAPDTKRAAAAVIEAAGGRYLDVAVMAPVHPLRRRVPLLVAGAHAAAAVAVLTEMGFGDVRPIGDRVGAASAIKMIRSVMVKGLEALSLECALAAEAAGVRVEVIASLDASWPGADWARRFDYNLDRMIVHGGRRADELDEVIKTLGALGVDSVMAQGAAARHRAVGDLAIEPPAGLTAKLVALLSALDHPVLEKAA